jgi:MFS family permease
VAEPPGPISRDFWTFWIGQTISKLGDSVSNFILPLLIFKLTGSAVNLALQVAAQMLPYLLFGLVIGAFVDRVERKRMMILTDLGRALMVATIPALAIWGELPVWWIYAVGFINSTLSIFFDAGEFAAIPSLVSQDDLVTANGRIQASYSAAQIIGPLIGGALLALIAIYDLIWVDATSFLVSAISIALVRKRFNTDDETETDPTTIWHDVREGLSYVLKHPVLRNISLMMAIVNFVNGGFYAEEVLFAKERLHATDSQIGILFAAGSAGIVITGLLAGKLRKRWSFSKVALTALMMNGLGIFIFSQMRLFWPAAIIGAIASGLGILFNINTGSLRQAIVPNKMLGRVMSIASVLAWSAIPLGAVLGGYIIEATDNVAAVFAGIGLLTIVIPMVFSFTPLGHADDYLPKPDRPAA